MDTSVAIQLIILLILLILSGFFSSAETALTTANKIRIRTLADEGNKRAKTLLHVTNNSGKMLSAILIGNNIVNLTASSLTTSLAYRLGGQMVAVATGVLTVLILLFGEITPKTMATIHAEKMGLAYAPIINVFMKLMTPVIFIINMLSHGFLKLLHINPDAKKQTMTEAELRTIVNVSHESGVIENEERNMINNVFDLTDSEAKEIMVPRIDMTFVDVNASYEKLLEIFREAKYTRLPVYEDTTDNVIGILNVKDLLLYDDRTNFSIRSIMREPFFTYEHKNTAELLKEMQASSLNIAIVLDEYGATAGLVTLEDLLEEIVGEIHDEYDANEEADITALNEKEYLVNGSMNLYDMCEKLGIHLESEDYDSIGGSILEHLDHLPDEGESITTENGILLRVEKMDKNRIEKVYLKTP